MIVVYTGKGKGKTTAALGLALRNIGHGRKVVIVQFMKKSKSGESKFANPLLELKQFGRPKLLTKKNIEVADKEAAKRGLSYAKNADCDLLVLDEANVALHFGLFGKKELLELVDQMDEDGVDVVLTGRNAPKELVERADIVTEMKELKHAFRNGVKARAGIEW